MHTNPELPEIPDDNHQGETHKNIPDRTQPTLSSEIATSKGGGIAPPVNHTRPTPPSPPQPRQRSTPPPSQRAIRMNNRGKARARRNRGYAPPLWSIALMMLFVIVSTGAIVSAIMTFGGKQAPEKPPQIIISSPIPSGRPTSFPVAPSTSTIPPEVDPNLAIISPLVLDGPTLEAVVFTAIPHNITVGETVVVNDVGPNQLNIREKPGVIDVTILFRAEEGEEFVIVDGPRQADGLTWWQLQDPGNPALVGWAASNYLILKDIEDTAPAP